MKPTPEYIPIIKCIVLLPIVVLGMLFYLPSLGHSMKLVRIFEEKWGIQ